MKTRWNRCNGSSLVEGVAIVATVALVIAFLFPLLRPHRLIICRTYCESYFVGLDADESKPERLLSGDRNIRGGRLSNGFLRVLQTNSAAGWTATIHTNVGNIGLADGSVQQMTPQMLQSQLKVQTFNNIRLAIP